MHVIKNTIHKIIVIILIVWSYGTAKIPLYSDYTDDYAKTFFTDYAFSLKIQGLTAIEGLSPKKAKFYRDYYTIAKKKLFPDLSHQEAMDKIIKLFNYNVNMNALDEFKKLGWSCLEFIEKAGEGYNYGDLTLLSDLVIKGRVVEYQSKFDGHFRTTFKIKIIQVIAGKKHKYIYLKTVSGKSSNGKTYVGLVHDAIPSLNQDYIFFLNQTDFKVSSIKQKLKDLDLTNTYTITAYRGLYGINSAIDLKTVQQLFKWKNEVAKMK